MGVCALESHASGKNFQLGKTKCGYLITYGISPFFKDELIKTIKSAPFLSVSFDESMNRVFQEEPMDVVIRFWDVRSN